MKESDKTKPEQEKQHKHYLLLKGLKEFCEIIQVQIFMCLFFNSLTFFMIIGLDRFNFS